ncbi:MAG: Gfo/Idh/MocA family oxidoreductase [Candidatus Nanopelagicales bacterium]|jgi:predicted dehydrogenase|nr:Gfo/Idh/MocA family oxidoreductase [Candidatus Nanopelagicales bacterium]
MSTSPIGYAIVGASRFAEFCLDAYRELDDLRPVAVCSRTPTHARTFAERHGLRPYPNLDTLLADPAVQLVHVASTPDRHPADAVAAMRRGRHVLCEKPLATTTAAAELMVRTAHRQDVRLGINFMMRHGPLWGPVHQILESQVLGAPLRADVLNCAGDDGLPSDHWFWDERRSGGILVEHGVHFFDLLASWLGPGRVTHGYAVHRPGSWLVDQVGAEVRHHEGALTSGHYHGFHQSRHLDRQEVRIVCERGELVLHGWVADRLELQAVLPETDLRRLHALLPEARAKVERRLEGAERLGSRRGGREPIDVVVSLDWHSPHEPDRVYALALADLMRDLLQGIRDRDHVPRVGAADGVAALRLAAAATTRPDAYAA